MHINLYFTCSPIIAIRIKESLINLFYNLNDSDQPIPDLSFSFK